MMRRGTCNLVVPQGGTLLHTWVTHSICRRIVYRYELAVAPDVRIDETWQIIIAASLWRVRIVIAGDLLCIDYERIVKHKTSVN